MGAAFFAGWWPIMKPVFDEAIAYVWESLADGGVSSERFYASHKEALALLGPLLCGRRSLTTRLMLTKSALR